MKRIRIKLVTLGNLKYPVKFSLVENWKSNVFDAQHVDQIQALPNAQGRDWSYPDAQLTDLIRPDDGYDFTVGVINAPLEYNYYLRRLNNNVCVLSLFETADILRYSNLTIEDFLIRNLYEICSFYLEGGRKIPDSAHSPSHDETRGCLFDMNANKADIVFSTERPSICGPCKTRIMSAQIAKDFLPSVEKELSNIRKALYYRMAAFVKTHPIYALAITTLSALLLNIVANYVYDYLKSSGVRF